MWENNVRMKFQISWQSVDVVHVCAYVQCMVWGFLQDPRLVFPEHRESGQLESDHRSDYHKGLHNTNSKSLQQFFYIIIFENEKNKQCDVQMLPATTILGIPWQRRCDPARISPGKKKKWDNEKERKENKNRVTYITCASSFSSAVGLGWGRCLKWRRCRKTSIKKFMRIFLWNIRTAHERIFTLVVKSRVKLNWAKKKVRVYWFACFFKNVATLNQLITSFAAQLALAGNDVTLICRGLSLY